MRRRQSAPRRWPPMIAIGAAGPRSPSAPSRPSASLSSWPSRCSRRAASWSPGSAAISARNGPPPSGRSSPWAAARSTGSRSTWPGSKATASSLQPRTARPRQRTRAIRASGGAGPGEHATGRLGVHADRRRLGRSFEPARPRCGPRRRRGSRRDLASRRHRRLRSGSRRRRRAARRTGRHRGPRQSRRGRRRRQRDRLVQRRCPGRHGVDTRRRSRRRRSPGCAALPQRREEADFTLVHGSPLDPTWEYVTTTAAARENLAAITTSTASTGTPTCRSPSASRAIEWDASPRAATRGSSSTGHRLLLNPGSVGQPRDGDPRASYMVLDLAARRGAAGAAWPTTSTRSVPGCGAVGLPQPAQRAAASWFLRAMP